MKASILFSSLLGQIFRHERIVLSVVAVLLLAGGYAAILNPMVRDIREVGILDYKRELRQLDDRRLYQGRLEASLEKFRALSPDVKTSLENALPTQDDLPGLFVFLDDMIIQSGMTLASVSVTPGAAVTSSSTPGDVVSPNLRALNIQLTATPNTEYQPVKTLLDNIEKSQRLFDVVSLTFVSAAPSKTDQSASGAVTISMRTYYLGVSK